MTQSLSATDPHHLAAVLLRSVAEAIIATDLSGHITLVNPAAEKLFAVKEEDVIGQPLRQMSFNPTLVRWLEQAIEEKSSQPVVFELEFPGERYFSASLAPLSDERQNRTGWVIVLQDVTHFKKVEHWRSEAIQTAAHDLRNPLNLMYGSTNLLRDSLPALTPEQEECLSMLRSGMERMGTLIEQLLNLETIEAGQAITTAKLAFRRLIEKTVDEFHYDAEKKGITLTFEGAAASAKIMGDESWLGRAITNLISNALKYTPTGGHVTVRYREADHMAICEVTDTGPGIPAAAQVRLFERFYRVRTATTRNTPGTGLGLAIVKSIIEKHAGRVWVSSEEGQGSTFGFAVPLIPTR
jgi:PAS domain S-box-containing protein